MHTYLEKNTTNQLFPKSLQLLVLLLRVAFGKVILVCRTELDPLIRFEMFLADLVVISDVLLPDKCLLPFALNDKNHNLYSYKNHFSFSFLTCP